MKRLFDVAVVVTSAVVVIPLLSVVAIMVRISMGRPVLFAQRRPGINGVPFYMWKFRTMRNTVDGQGNLLPDDERLTAFGRWLRASSLDELPALWNVLRGDMSLVGPRPLLMEYLPLYSHEQARRHRVRPGITGWAQINGRNAISWEEKFILDVWYVDNQSFWLDIKILFMTVSKVLKRDGINAEGDITMPRFKGTRDS